MATELDSASQQRLLTLALKSIDIGLESGAMGEFCPSSVDADERLLNRGACFVTLKKSGQLRGCIGHLQAMMSLAESAFSNAHGAAFRDPRFPALQAQERNLLQLSISVLSEPEAFPVRDEADLMDRLQPGTDGLILSYGRHRATFLPAVWETLPQPQLFLSQLKKKAGLAPDFWHSELHFQRYRSDSFGAAVGDLDSP